MTVVLHLAPDLNAKALWAARHLVGARVARSEAPPGLWLRGDIENSELPPALKRLPRLGCYHLDPTSDKLVPWGKRLPVASLPDGLEWCALERFIGVRFPAVAMPGRRPARSERARLELVRSANVVSFEANLWLSSLEALQNMVRREVATRFSHCQFAVSADGQAVLRGNSLPALPGRGYRCENGLALPLGWDLEFRVNGETIRSSLGLTGGDDVAVIHLDGSVDLIREADWKCLSRSAVRATVYGMADLEEWGESLEEVADEN